MSTIRRIKKGLTEEDVGVIGRRRKPQTVRVPMEMYTQCMQKP